ncbi:Dimer-Tnp-hAT domain-containing protein [Mycena sanguinolenta]|uniref:Dimer-Tnp-hAT domain-containing protein n=1 Tax=Mycena sanguinolenta TaxID=230812 RepID=A0A8H6XUC0_9AGAR|nr:Dimer-Tnp-hAT domain-containing protein [Mycena sanguinolenta]
MPPRDVPDPSLTINTPRIRNAPSRLTDASNSEAPSAAHQAVIKKTQARRNDADVILARVETIANLSKLLPDTVSEGTEEDEIYRVITTVQGLDEGSISSTFNRRFDILFKEDGQCRDENGRLHLIRRGDLGMLLVVKYLQEIKWTTNEMLKSLKSFAKCRPRMPKKRAAEKPSKAKGKGKAEAVSASKKTSAAQRDAFVDSILLPKLKAKDGEYRPKKPAVVSEEEEDDFEDDAEDAAAVSNEAGRKRKKIVLEGEKHEPVPKRPKKAAAKTSQPVPNVEVIEVDDESDTEPRAHGKRGPKSSTRDFFLPPVAIRTHGEKRWAFKCRHPGCPSTLSVKRTVGKDRFFDDESPAPPIRNLTTHLRTDHDNAPLPSDTVPGGSKLNPIIDKTEGNFLKIFAAWIVEDDLAFTTGETVAIARLFKFLNSRYMLPSDTTVRNTLATMFADMYRLVKSELADIQSKLAISTDTWTTRSMHFTFAGTIGSWISSDWKLIERVLDFHPIEDKEHEGEYAAIGVAKRLADFNVLEKIISLDNTATNDVLMRALSRILRDKFDIQFVPENSQIRCLAHIVNLVVQKILAVLDEEDDPATRDDYVDNKELPIHYNIDEDPELEALEAEIFESADGPETEEDEAVDMMNALADELAGLTRLQKRFRKAAEEKYQDQLAPSGKKLATLMVVRDVRHRWNYTHAMIRRGLLLHKAIDKWVLDRPELRPLYLSPADWSYLQSLGDLLELFTSVTLQMSRSSTPTLPWVLPMYEKMLTHLRGYTTHTSLGVATTAGLHKLETYYEKARGCQFNVIATLLHPSLGLAWFRKIDLERGTSDRAPTAQVIFEHAYKSYKRIHNTQVASERANRPKAVTPSHGGTMSSFLDDVCMDDVEDVLDDVTSSSDSELKRWWNAFHTYGRGEKNAPLAWWKANERYFPIVSKMARDFLAIPGTSVSVERLFSSSRHLCREVRGSFKAETIKEAMLTKMWLKAGFLKSTLSCGRG